MVRLVLIGAVVLLAFGAGRSEALTLAQVEGQAANAADDLALQLGVDLVLSAGVSESDLALEIEVDSCRKTSRRRGSCAVDVSEATTGEWCTAVAVIRVARRGRLTRALREIGCGGVA